jgi:hypothetical protein
MTKTILQERVLEIQVADDFMKVNGKYRGNIKDDAIGKNNIAT